MSSRAGRGQHCETEGESMNDDVQSLVGPTYRALADLLGKEPPERWDTPSLCTEWRVREVVAHVTMPANYDEAAFMAELQQDGFDFGRLSNRIAARDAKRPTDELVAGLRSDVLHRWQPPGGGAHGALNHAVIHSLDVTVPLGEKPAASDEALRVILDDLTAGGVQRNFGVDVSGRRLTATDLAWSYGNGSPLAGTAGDLVAALAGRALPEGRLDGEPLARIA
jgi:uncharacterized protein (TIGR03083 family)